MKSVVLASLLMTAVVTTSGAMLGCDAMPTEHHRINNKNNNPKANHLPASSALFKNTAGASQPQHAAVPAPGMLFKTQTSATELRNQAAKKLFMEALEKVQERIRLEGPDAINHNYFNEATPQDFYDVCDQVKLLGYPCEHHNATTVDGFVIDIVRIPSTTTGAYPVILQHGLIDSAITWVANANSFQNLGCILHDQGFDVYMPNARGNHYSEKNVIYNKEDPEYWQRIDMDFMAKYDMEAYVNFILKFTGHATASYVGHSQGGMMGFAAFSTSNPALAAKIDHFVALAPACYVGHVNSVAKLLAEIDLASILQALGLKSFLTSDFWLHIFSEICPDIGHACALLIDILCGPGNPSNVNATQIPHITKYTPGGTSVSNMVHWLQEIRSDRFQMHDFGSSLNNYYYNQSSAPQYNLSAMTGPNTTVFYGSEDTLADPTDVARIIDEVPKGVITGVEVVPGYSHLDFVWGLDAFDTIYGKVAVVLKKAANNAAARDHKVPHFFN